jgi:hypothetical protein
MDWWQIGIHFDSATFGKLGGRPATWHGFGRYLFFSYRSFVLS